MNCRFDQELLTGYYDGELNDREKSSVEEHIAACSHCLRLLGEVKDGSVQVRTLPRVAAPASVRENVARQLRSPLGRARVWFNAAVAAAALVLVSVSVVIISNREQAPAPDLARTEVERSLKTGAAPAPNAPPANALKDVTPRRHGDDPLSRDADGARESLEKLKEQQKQLADPGMGAPADKGGEKKDGRWSEGGESFGGKKPAEPEMRNRKEEPKEEAKDEKAADRKKADHNEADDAETAEGGKRTDEANRKNLEDASKFKAELEKKSKGATAGKIDKAAGFAANAPSTPVVSVRSAELGKVRGEIEALVKEFRGARSTIGAAELGSDSNVNDRYLTLELTEAEYEALQKHLASMKSVEVAEGSLEAERERTLAWRRQLRAANKSNEPAAEEPPVQDEQLTVKELKEKDAPAAKQPSGPGATPPPAPSKPSADPKPAERPADPAAADDLKREPAQAGGASGGGGAGRTRGAVARKRYILVFEEKPKK